ncbi:biogenesis of lysosome-related organelles complex 1 subunit 5 isoform X2 [Arctopsyche grandis]|uniref:biogenesis of lysosome-related organelles complex 1 subunit 5 isoform X2 n=1 Tax=Arctopsyche grandis TaxID=121162 RepID=UPI00406D94C1
MPIPIRDCGELWSRLFDHRPFINGELKFMLREFENKRSDREVENLFSIIENATEIKDNQVERLKELSETNIPKLTDALNKALEETEAIFKVEQDKLKDNTLEKNREERKKQWNVFIESMSEKYTRIDNAFEQKEEELNDFYTDLEHKLNVTTK